MGVDRTDHIIYGYKLPYELKNESGKIDLWDDKFLPMIEGHKGEEFTIISDSMCGEYNVFGIRIQSGDGGWNFVQLDFKNLDPEKVKSKYREVFELKKDEPIPEPYLFIFSHFLRSQIYSGVLLIYTKNKHTHKYETFKET